MGSPYKIGITNLLFDSNYWQKNGQNKGKQNSNPPRSNYDCSNSLYMHLL